MVGLRDFDGFDFLARGSLLVFGVAGTSTFVEDSCSCSNLAFRAAMALTALTASAARGAAERLLAKPHHTLRIAYLSTAAFPLFVSSVFSRDDLST